MACFFPFWGLKQQNWRSASKPRLKDNVRKVIERDERGGYIKDSVFCIATLIVWTNVLNWSKPVRRSAPRFSDEARHFFDISHERYLSLRVLHYLFILLFLKRTSKTFVDQSAFSVINQSLVWRHNFPSKFFVKIWSEKTKCRWIVLQIYYNYLWTAGGSTPPVRDHEAISDGDNKDLLHYVTNLNVNLYLTL